jgi:hypothetical protein
VDLGDIRQALADTDYGSSAETRAAYIRGYFDAEGGCPRDPNARFYLQFVQKNYADINELHSLLAREGIDCGQIHNPSRRKDPDLWRFYVAARHHLTFAMRIGSWHPRKRGLLDAKFALRNEDEDIVRAPWRHGG